MDTSRPGPAGDDAAEDDLDRQAPRPTDEDAIVNAPAAAAVEPAPFDSVGRPEKPGPHPV